MLTVLLLSLMLFPPYIKERAILVTALPEVVPKKPKTKVVLRCTPSISISASVRSALFRASLRIENPGDRYWCPEVQWLINGSRDSSHQAGCNPYEQVVKEEGEPKVWEEPTKEFWLRSGEYHIVVKLIKAGRVIGQQECTVNAR